jgi:hypothetical protein
MIGISGSELREFNAEVAGIEIKVLRLPAGVISVSGLEAPPKK